MVDATVGCPPPELVGKILIEDNLDEPATYSQVAGDVHTGQILTRGRCGSDIMLYPNGRGRHIREIRRNSGVETTKMFWSIFFTGGNISFLQVPIVFGPVLLLLVGPFGTCCAYRPCCCVQK